MRKLCIDEVGEVKMKKNEKNEKNCIFLLLFIAAPLALHFKDGM